MAPENTKVTEPQGGSPEQRNPEQKEPEQKTVYTAEELAELNPEAIDIERVDPAARPIVERTIRDYKALQGDYTKKSQELAELKRTPAEPETYFEDAKKNDVFKDYLKNPMKVIADINAELANLETVIPDDGAEEYRKARRAVAYWNGIKDEFSAKRIEISDRQRQSEIAEATIKSELGADYQTLMDYAVNELGLPEKEFKRNAKLREAVKKTYSIANASKSAASKEVKPKPPKTSAPSGNAGDGGGRTEEEIVMDPNTSTEERLAIWKKRRAAA